jgi:ribonuclease Z
MQLDIYFLGTGGSWPSINRNVSATVIKRGRESILFDCGEGTQRQIQHTNLSYMQIKNIFITHYHGDHFLGLPGLIQTMQLNDRKEPLNIYGTSNTHKIVESIINLGYFSPDFKIISHELESGDSLQFEGYTIKCMEVCHNVPSLAYCLEEENRPGKFNKKRALELGVPEGPLFRKLQYGKNIEVNRRKITPDMVIGKSRPGRKITITGDTTPSAKLIEFAKKSDVLIHDATFDTSLAEKGNAYGHSTALQAAKIAQNAQVGILILTHVSPRYKDAKILEKEAQQLFPQSYVAYDFMKLSVKLKK